MEIIEILKYIDPSRLNYQEWVNVGMALKDAGCPCDVWDRWSRKDIRYHEGECEKKWQGFSGSEEPVTAGTIYHYALEQGYRPPQTSMATLDWNDEISYEGDLVIDTKSLEIKTFSEPDEWHPGKELTRYLETLFEANDIVGFVTDVWEKNDNGKIKYLPTSGSWSKTAGQLIAELTKYGDDIGAVIGDYKEEAGAWIRFNPLDGNGVKNDNVTEYRYALIESDTVSLEEQNTIIRELELPVAVLVYSGGKSLHAIVKVDAADKNEYRKRVDYIYSVCAKNGFEIDKQNRNPSRLSRMPGVTRNGKKQYIIDTNIGKSSFDEWKEWIEGLNDDLPEIENLAAEWDTMPPLAPPLINGLLRRGHKMLLAGPSKAGKSFALIELCIAIAEGRPWMGFECERGRVMYVNLELDRASCLHRFKDVYTAMGIPPEHTGDIDIWDLRGRSETMNKLAPKLIRRAQKHSYAAIIIDPIYKVITGDENSADQMAHFCNQFDKICSETKSAVIYCHHHSKGAQGGKRSMDRASGSGVFARDPDALLDMIELPVSDQIRKTEEDKAVCAVCSDWLHRFLPDYSDVVSQDDEQSRTRMTEHCLNYLKTNSMELLRKDIAAAVRRAQAQTAWRLEGTLREFPKFAPINIWFDYPLHYSDRNGTLKDVDPEETWQANFSKKKTNEQRSDERKALIDLIFEGQENDGVASVKQMAEACGKSEDTVRRYLKENGNYWIENGKCGKKAEPQK